MIYSSRVRACRWRCGCTCVYSFVRRGQRTFANKLRYSIHKDDSTDSFSFANDKLNERGVLIVEDSVADKLSMAHTDAIDMKW